MSGKNRLYLALNITIAVAFVLSLATALVWLFSESGRQAAPVLGITRSTWGDLHTWFSLVMIAGAVIHLALHWEWLVAMTRRLRAGKAKKARWNYLFDGVLGLVLVAATGTGLVFLLAGGGGYQGGRNPYYQAVILGLGRELWSDLHLWFGLGFLAVLVTHQVLHWSWIKNVWKRIGRPAAPAATEARLREAPVQVTERAL